MIEKDLSSPRKEENTSIDTGLFKNHLLAIGKLKYAQDKRPQVDCIFCAVKENDPRVEALKIYEEDLLFISLNMYPYNPGHLMVIPTRHVEQFEDLSAEERNRIFQVTMDCQQCLRALFSPTGFNVGYNQGKFSGASINHIHVHIVPRFPSELGYIDLISHTRITVLPVSEVFKSVKEAIPKFISSYKS